MCMCLCALELFFACHGPDCKFFEKSVSAGVNNWFTVLSFTVENNTTNIIRNYANSRDVSLMQLRILQKSWNTGRQGYCFWSCSSNDPFRERSSEKERRFEPLPGISARRYDILSCGTSQRDSKLTSCYLYVLPVRSEAGSTKRKRQQQES